MTDEALRDSGEPHRARHNRAGGRKLDKSPRPRLLSDIEVRFVYEGELYGAWFKAADALDIPALPNPDHRVIRIQFRDTRDNIKQEKDNA